ncbi:MAG: CDP-alcohol phosphatidyltransferase family protein, partial [Nanoarchaeota archaeon]|nr:CDP-alcohol phosphatidyltransferase family protein [Nanoarchaeota archaeon]
MYPSTKEIQEKCYNNQDLKVLDIHRRLAVPILKLLLQTKITANHITIIRAMTIILGFIFFLKADIIYAIIGSLIFEIGIILDTLDGAIARYRKESSSLGEFMDAFLDHLGATVLYFLSAGIFVYLRSANKWCLLITI